MNPAITSALAIAFAFMILLAVRVRDIEHGARKAAGVVVSRARQLMGPTLGSVRYAIDLVASSYGARIVEIEKREPGRVIFTAKDLPWEREIALLWPPWRRAAFRRVADNMPAGIVYEVHLD